MAAAVHQFACQLDVLLQQGFFDSSFLVFQKTCQEVCGNIRDIRPIRVLNELLAKTKGCTILLVIGTTCQLNEAATFESLAIPTPGISQVFPIVVSGQKDDHRVTC